jgi:UDP-glucose 4-epimerase
MLRYFNVIGNDPEGEIFERHEPETHVLPNLISAAMSGGSFSLFGTNHDTPDGTAVRDYVHVMDLGQAHIRAIDELGMRKRLVSNVGAGAGVSVRELLSIVEKELGLRVDVEEKPIRPGDPPRLVADNAYLRTWFDHTFKSVDQAVRDIAATSRTMS